MRDKSDVIGRNYFGEFIFLWVKAGMVYFVGGWVFAVLGQQTFSKEGGICAALIIFGFTFFDKVVRFNLFGNHDIVLVFWILKVFISALIGMIAFPIVNIPSLTLVKIKSGYKPSNYAGGSYFPFENDLCYFFASSVLVLFMMLLMADFEINS